MSFATDLAFHDAGTSAVVVRFRTIPLELIRTVVEREGLRTKRTFVEFYNEHAAPSPTGLLLTPALFWPVIVNESFSSPSVARMRKLCLPKFLKRVEWGGDHGAFAGVLVDLSRLGSYMVEPLTPHDMAETERLRQQILLAPAPMRQATQDCLWPDDLPQDETESDFE